MSGADDGALTGERLEELDTLARKLAKHSDLSNRERAIVDLAAYARLLQRRNAAMSAMVQRTIDVCTRTASAARDFSALSAGTGTGDAAFLADWVAELCEALCDPTGATPVPRPEDGYALAKLGLDGEQL